MTKLEEAARAIRKVKKSSLCSICDRIPHLARCLCKEEARAVIEALREPTETMVVAGCNHENMGDMAGRYKAMIDALLNEGQQ